MADTEDGGGLVSQEDLQRGVDLGKRPGPRPDRPDATAPLGAAPPTVVPPPRSPAAPAWPPVGVPVPSSWDGRGVPPPSGPVPAVHPAGWGPPPAVPGPPSGPMPVPGPPQGGGTGRGVLIGALVALLVVGGGVGAWFGFADDGSTPEPPAASAPADAAAGAGKDLDEGSAPTQTTSEAPATPTVSPEEQALAELEALRERSLSEVVLDGRWVAQVASKDVGIHDPLQTTEAGSHEFLAADILAESRSMLALADASEVHVLTSLDFGRRSTADDGDPYWITFVDAGFSSGDDVRAWCAGAFPSLRGDALANACVARTLEPSHA